MKNKLQNYDNENNLFFLLILITRKKEKKLMLRAKMAFLSVKAMFYLVFILVLPCIGRLTLLNEGSVFKWYDLVLN